MQCKTAVCIAVPKSCKRKSVNSMISYRRWFQTYRICYKMSLNNKQESHCFFIIQLDLLRGDVFALTTQFKLSEQSPGPK